MGGAINHALTIEACRLAFEAYGSLGVCDKATRYEVAVGRVVTAAFVTVCTCLEQAGAISPMAV